MKFTSALVIAVLAAVTSVNAQPREVLTLDLTSSQKVVEVDTRDGFILRADNYIASGDGWELGVYRKGSDDNLLYPQKIWHGAFPCQIVPSSEDTFPSERVIPVRGTSKRVTVKLVGVLVDDTTAPYRFRAGVARVFWDSTSNKSMETDAKKPRGSPPR